MKKTCLNCPKQFIPAKNHPYQKFHSKTCQVKYWVKHNIKRIRSYYYYVKKPAISHNGWKKYNKVKWMKKYCVKCEYYTKRDIYSQEISNAYENGSGRWNFEVCRKTCYQDKEE